MPQSKHGYTTESGQTLRRDTRRTNLPTAPRLLRPEGHHDHICDTAGCRAVPGREGSESEMRDPRIDPVPGDKLGYRGSPDKRVALRFTDATGVDRLWVTTTRVTTVKTWRKWAKNAIVVRRGDADVKDRRVK